MNNSNFYENIDFTYPEIAVCIEDSDGEEAKFFIPILTPFLSNDDPFDKLDPVISKLNILNKYDNNLDISQCTSSNYIILELPYECKSNGCKKGDKFIITFIGGDINKPYILGRYNK